MFVFDSLTTFARMNISIHSMGHDPLDENGNNCQ